MKNLEIEFQLEKERRYLLENSTEAVNLALNHLEDFLYLAVEIKVLEQKYQSVLSDNQLLTSQLIEMYCFITVTSASIESISMPN